MLPPQQSLLTPASIPQNQLNSQRTFDQLVQVACLVVPAVAVQPPTVAADITTILDAVLAPLSPKQSVVSLLSKDLYISALTSHLSRTHVYYKDLDRHPRPQMKSEPIFTQSTQQTLESLYIFLTSVPSVASVCCFSPPPIISFLSSSYSSLSVNHLSSTI